jgi:hypothetical protein
MSNYVWLRGQKGRVGLCRMAKASYCGYDEVKRNAKETSEWEF